MTGGTATPAGLLFGPNHSGKKYLSSYAHRRNNPRDRHKSHWLPSVTPLMEFGIFCSADRASWRDGSGNYWGLHSGTRTILGVRGERLCKFPYTSNATDPWHGFPVSPLERGDNDAPPDTLVDDWVSAGVISRVAGRKIQRRKL
jgi:hypothetical protein